MTPLTSDVMPPRAGRTERILVLGGLGLAAVLLVSALGAWTENNRMATVARESAVQLTPAQQLAAQKYEAGVARRRHERAEAVRSYSARYQIPADLSGAIYDHALAAGIQPSVAYRLVQVESNFKRTARSTADAFGYTQVQLPTARHYDRSVTVTRLMDRDVNLRLGFRYLRDLLSQFEGDMHLALLAYNRGPGRVEQILAEGGDPGNGYSSAVLRTGKPAGVTVPMRGVTQ